MSNNKVEVSAPVTLAAAGNSATVPIPFINSAGVLSAHVYGTFGGTTVTMQASLDGTNWSTVGGSITAAGVISAVIATRFARIVATGGTGISLTAKFGF